MARNKSLKVHPDKIGDSDPKATDLFIQLTVAYNTLRDPIKRQEYDQSYKAKRDQIIRTQQMHSVRRRAKEDLEAREEAAKKQKVNDELEEKKMKLEVERLREEGMKLMREKSNPSMEKPKATIKIKWSKKETWTESQLKNIFSKFGSIATLICSPKGGMALLEYHDVQDGFKVISDSSLSSFKLSWASGEPPILESHSTTSMHASQDLNQLEEQVFAKLRQKHK